MFLILPVFRLVDAFRQYVVKYFFFFNLSSGKGRNAECWRVRDTFLLFTLPLPRERYIGAKFFWKGWMERTEFCKNRERFITRNVSRMKHDGVDENWTVFPMMHIPEIRY